MTKSLVVQSDLTVLLEAADPNYSETRDFLNRFAILEKCPEHFHTYRITDLSLWNAASLGINLGELLAGLAARSKHPLPSSVLTFIQDKFSLFGKLRLITHEEQTWLCVIDLRFEQFVFSHSDLQLFFDHEQNITLMPLSVDGAKVSCPARALHPNTRGKLKVALIKLGFPVDDQAGFAAGDAIPSTIDPRYSLRDYQHSAADSFFALPNVDCHCSSVWRR